MAGKIRATGLGLPMLIRPEAAVVPEATGRAARAVSSPFVDDAGAHQEGPEPATLDRVVAALRAGQAVVLPTDTVYGVAALPSVPGATEQLLALKGRPATRPLAVLVADAAQAWILARPDHRARRLAASAWPGPLTMVLPRRPEASRLALGGDPSTVGIRCPDHALVRAVAAEVGPIATTSANRSGQPTPTTAAAAAAALAGSVAEVVDGGELSALASTVVDLTGTDPVVLRAGAFGAEDLERLMADR